MQKGFWWISLLIVLLLLAGFVYAWVRLNELRPPISVGIEQELDRGKEERKKKNPVTIGQFMGKPYDQVSMQDVLNKMIHEGSALDLYWVRENVWSCRWERHGKKFTGLGLDPEDAIAAAIAQFLPAASPTP